MDTAIGICQASYVDSGARGVVHGPESARLADNRVPTKLRKCYLFLQSPIHVRPCRGPGQRLRQLRHVQVQSKSLTL